MSQRPCILGLQAADRAELRQAAAVVAQSLRDPAGTPKPGDCGRGGVRLLARGATAESLADALAAFSSGECDPAVEVQERTAEAPRVAFVFAGQSEIRAGMGAELYGQSPCYAEVIDRCSFAMGEALGTRLAEGIYASEDASLLDDARLAQPALFALQGALVALWKQWGVTPEMVAGHSLGEYAAACAAGVMSVDDGIRLVAARGALTQSLARSGLMAVLFATEESVVEIVADNGEGVSIAAVNAPEVVVVSGEADGITELLANADARGIGAKVLHISHPFHSRCIDPMLDRLEEVAASTPINKPSVPFASTLEGRLLESHESLDATYWRRHAREPVRFLDAMRELVGAGCTIFLELGPHATLTGLGERCVDERAAMWLPSLKRSGHNWRVLTETATKLWLAGVEVDLAAMAGSSGWDLLLAPRVAEEAGTR